MCRLLRGQAQSYLSMLSCGFPPRAFTPKGTENSQDRNLPHAILHVHVFLTRVWNTFLHLYLVYPFFKAQFKSFFFQKAFFMATDKTIIPCSSFPKHFALISMCLRISFTHFFLYSKSVNSTQQGRDYASSISTTQRIQHNVQILVERRKIFIEI